MNQEIKSLIAHPGTWIILGPFIIGAILAVMLVSNAESMQGIRYWMIWLFISCFAFSTFIVVRSPRAREDWKPLLGFPIIGMLLIIVGSGELFAKTGSNYDPSKPFTAMANELMPALAELGITVGPVALLIYFIVKAWPDRHRLLKSN